MMELITNSPGLQHIPEDIFLLLDWKDLKTSLRVNKSWNKILNNPSIWLKKCVQKGHLKQHKTAWKKAVGIVKNSDLLEKNLTLHLKEIFFERFRLNNGLHYDYLQAKFWKNLQFVDFDPIYWAAMRGDAEVINVLIPFTDDFDPNASGQDEWTPIQRASENGHAEVVKLLAPLVEKPNAPNPDGYSPIRTAARLGNQEIIEVMVPYSDTLSKFAAIAAAAEEGYVEIIKYLAQFVKNPNCELSLDFDKTPIYLAVEHGQVEVVNYLAPLAENPNSSVFGSPSDTPLKLAAWLGYSEIIKVLAPYTDKNSKFRAIEIGARNKHVDVIKVLTSMLDRPIKKSNLPKKRKISKRW